MKLELFVLVLCIFKTAAAVDSSTTESTVTSNNTTDVANASTTVEITTDSDSGNDATASATDSGVESDNMTSTTSASVTDGIEENSTMSSTNNEATTEPLPPAGDETTAATQQNTTEENTASTASSNTVQQDTAPIATTTTVAASMASSNTTQQDTASIATTTTVAASMASSNTTQQDTASIATTTTVAASMASSNTTQQDTTPIASTTTVAATNPCLDTAVVQQCKSQNFTTCVNDGSGQHHCEGCLGGWTLSNGTCRKLPRVIGKVTIKFIDGATASFSVDLTNRNSAQFIKLAMSCCESFLRASIALECNVTSFTEGSIVVSFVLGYPENEANINQTALSESILDDATANGFGLDPDVQLSVVTVFCEDTTCENDGNCYINDSMMTQCNCTGGYTGSDCSVSPATTLTPTAAADSAMALSTEAIIGIAVGCSLALLIIIIIVIVICKYKGKNKIGSKTELGRQQRPEDEVPLQKR